MEEENFSEKEYIVQLKSSANCQWYKAVIRLINACFAG